MCSTEEVLKQQNILRVKIKVNSVQEACAKCFVVHISKFEIVQTHEETNQKNQQNARSIDEKLKIRV